MCAEICLSSYPSPLLWDESPQQPYDSHSDTDEFTVRPITGGSDQDSDSGDDEDTLAGTREA